MNEQLSQTENAGDWQTWEHIWSQAETKAGTLVFRRGRPRNLREFWQRCYFEDLWKLIHPVATTGKFIELGCGRGTTSMYLADRGCDVTLVDMSPTALILAKRNFAEHGFKAPALVKTDAQETMLPSASFDCAYGIGVLEHFEDPTSILQESLRLLKPGGLLFQVIVPRISLWRSYPLRLLMNPIRTIPTSILNITIRRNRPVERPGDAVRTSYSDAWWTDKLRQLGQSRATCFSYNPYFDTYKHPKLEEWISIPIYRLHHALKRVICKGPTLRTWPALASTQLLLCWKT